jgi:hypothetical protein
MDELLLTIHIASACAWLGASILQGLVMANLDTKSPAAASWWHTTTAGFTLKLYTPAAVLLAITGMTMIVRSDDVYSMGNAFVSIGFVTIIIGAAMGVKFFAPQARLAAAAYDAGTDASAIESKIKMGGTFDIVLMLVTIFAMISKWGV